MKGSANTIRAGFAKLDITPAVETMEVFGLGYWFARAVRFTGVRDSLFVRAVALGEDAACQLLISVDAIFDSFGFVPDAVGRVSSELGLPAENVFITCTHTHSTPLIRRNGTERGAEYGMYVADRIVVAATLAFRRRKGTAASVSCGNIPRVLYNRRPLLKNGQIAELHVPLDPETVMDAGLVDDALTLVKFHGADGEFLGAVCHFGIHGVAVQCSELISSDCMGRAIQRVEALLGAVIVHLNGPCGDIDPIVMGDDAALDVMTERLSAGLERVNAAEEISVSMTPQQSRASRFRVLRRSARAAVEQVGGNASSNEQHHSGPGYEQFLIREEQAVAAMPAEFDVPYQILRTGDLIWVGVGGEIFTCFGLKLKALVPNAFVLPVGITGESRGYLPPERAFSQGGYEVACAQWCPIAPGETEKLFAQMERDVSG